MGYNFFQKFPIMKALESERLVQRAIKLKWGGERYYQETRNAGLSFRKQDVLYDYRRASTIEQSRSLTAKGKAESWFENVLERIRDEKGLTQKQAMDVWSEMKRKQEELEAFTEEEEEYWKSYEGLW